MTHINGDDINTLLKVAELFHKIRITEEVESRDDKNDFLMNIRVTGVDVLDSLYSPDMITMGVNSFMEPVLWKDDRLSALSGHLAEITLPTGYFHISRWNILIRLILCRILNNVIPKTYYKGVLVSVRCQRERRLWSEIGFESLVAYQKEKPESVYQIWNGKEDQLDLVHQTRSLPASGFMTPVYMVLLPTESGTGPVYLPNSENLKSFLLLSDEIRRKLTKSKYV